MKGYSKEQVMDAIQDSHGIVLAVAQKLGCAWHTADGYINKWKDTKEAMEQENEGILDLAESRLYEAVDNKEPWAVRYLLNNKAKGRGYGWKNVKVEQVEPPKVVEFYEDSGTPEDSEA